MDQEVGFIGVGRMGGPMARRLMEAGYKLTIFDSSEEAMGPLLEKGATRAASVKSLCDAVEIVFCSLPTPPIVEAVALGPGGVIEGTKVRLFIDTSTTGSIYAKRVAEGLAAKNILEIDAPISGGVTGANKGTLAIMVSCPEDVLERLKPILSHLGKVFFIGTQPGMGHTMKLLNNILSATAMAISSEAVVMGVKAGLDPKVICEVINSGTGRNSATADKIPRLVFPRKFDGGFAVGLLNKDIRLFMDEADALQVPTVVAAAVKQVLVTTMAMLGPQADMSEIIRTIENLAHVEVKA
ncbi:MAG TPA: NAD(P)-dependent oxidoreductase [Bryobacteraceae bacterium]|jgi:3-hydroxyisobutyrate dehydrogenase-like beta-hydroxyacid dehydrogenase